MRPTVHLPYPAVAAPSPFVFIRSSGDPTVLARPATDTIRVIDATIPVYDVQSMNEVHRSALLRSEMIASLFSVLGVIAVLLAATGIYGVLSYVVSQRTHEVGIRMALGADRGAVVWLVVRDGLAMIAAGTLVGLVGAVTVTRVARGLLYEVSATDPVSFLGAALLLGLIGWLASYAPARRAARVNPAVALRD